MLHDYGSKLAKNRSLFRTYLCWCPYSFNKTKRFSTSLTKHFMAYLKVLNFKTLPLLPQDFQMYD